jgi:hypothetical protein
LRSLDYPDTILNALTHSDVLTDIISHNTMPVNDSLSVVKVLADRKNYYVITLITGLLFPSQPEALLHAHDIRQQRRSFWRCPKNHLAAPFLSYREARQNVGR